MFCVANVWVCTRDQADYPVYVHGAAVVTVTAAEQQRVDLIVEGMRGPVIARRGARRGRGRRVNVLDLIELLLCFGQPGDPPCDTADLNADGAVNVLDLIDLLLAFGTACP